MHLASTTIDTTQGARANRRRQSPARALRAALGRLILLPPDPERPREPMFGASRFRLSIA